jgi:tetratricopeptide (TPR) repeat protein
MRILIFTLIASFVLFSCQEDNTSSGLKNAEKLVKEDPSKENVERLVQTIISAYKSTEEKQEKIVLLNKGLKVAKEHGLTKEVSSFRLGIITEDPLSEQSGNLLLTIANEIKNAGKEDVYNVMMIGIRDNYESLAGRVSKNITNPDVNVDTMILQIGKSIFPPDDPTNINKSAAHKYVDLSEAYALSNPKSEQSIDYLFKAAEMARSLKSYNKALSLYDIILARYPKTKKAASALFVKAFLMDNNFNNQEEAKKLYLEFLERYPNDDLADDVEVLINNLGKTDEELYNSVKKES